MSNPELDKLLASVDAAIRRAYALGRKEALDQLVKYARSDDVVSPPLALAAPDLAVEPDSVPMAGANDDRAYEDARMEPARNGSASLGDMIRDFVFPARAS